MQPKASSPAQNDALPADESLAIEAAYREPKSAASLQLVVNGYHTLTDTVHRENLDILRQLDS